MYSCVLLYYTMHSKYISRYPSGFGISPELLHTVLSPARTGVCLMLSLQIFTVRTQART